MMRKLKFTFLGLLLLFPIFSFANPIEVYPTLSEVYFDENQNWKIEITNCFGAEYDSIMIESSSGIMKIMNFVSEYYDFTVITTDSLEAPLSIQETGDFIKLYFYHGIYIYHTEFVAFGNYENSYIHNLQEGYSIARHYEYDYYYSEYFYKCITPTLGFPNELENSKGHIIGNIYINNELLTNETFKLDETSIAITNDGFDGFIFSRTYSNLLYHNQVCVMLPLSVEPNETIYSDIYFTYVSVNDIEKENTTFSVFPNPTKDLVQFYYKTQFQNSHELVLEIRDLNGKLVDKINLLTNDGFLTYNIESINNGLYICSLLSNDIKLREIKLIIL